MLIRREPNPIEAEIADLTDDEREEFRAVRKALSLADVSDEVDRKLANGEYQPGDRFPIMVDGREVLVTFGGPVDCC